MRAELVFMALALGFGWDPTLFVALRTQGHTVKRGGGGGSIMVRGCFLSAGTGKTGCMAKVARAKYRAIPEESMMLTVRGLRLQKRFTFHILNGLKPDLNSIENLVAPNMTEHAQFFQGKRAKISKMKETYSRILSAVIVVRWLYRVLTQEVNTANKCLHFERTPQLKHFWLNLHQALLWSWLSFTHCPWVKDFTQSNFQFMGNL